MGAPIRISGVPAVTGKISDPVVRQQLQALTNAIDQLSGNGDLAALRRAELLALIKAAIRQPGVLPGPSAEPPTDGPLAADPYFQALQKQVTQAQADLAYILASADSSELLVRENINDIGELQAGAEQTATDLADLADQLAANALDLLDLATQVDAIQVSIDDPDTGLLATSTLVNATVTRVDATEDSIDVITAQITSLQSEIVDTSALDPGIMWQFEGDDDDWTSNATLTTNTFYVRVGAFASGYFLSPDGIVIDGRLYTRVVARIRRVSGTGWLGRVSYATDGGSAHGIDPTNFNATLVTSPVFAGGGWVIVTWDMELLTAGGTDWVDNIIDQIQLELSDDGSTIYEVDWIAIGRIAPSYVTAVVSALEARVTATEDGIDALSSTVTSLSTTVDGLEDDTSANSTAISGLETRVTTAEGSLTTLSSSVTSLSTRMTTAEGNITATSTALSGLTTTVTSLSGTVSTNSSAITSLTSRMTAAEGVNTSQATAITSLNTSVSTINSTLTSQASSLTSLDSRLTSAEGVNTSQATAISGLNTRVTTAEGTITSHSSSLTSLDSRVTAAEGVNSGQATAITNLTTSVTTFGSQIAANAASVTMLQVYARDANRLNPLTLPGNATDWPTFANSDVLNVNVGGRIAGAARRRTSGNFQDTSKFFEIDPKGIYEVRVSVAASIAHGYLYVGLDTSADGSTATASAIPIKNQVISGGVDNNPYWTFAGVQFVNHTVFLSNTWYDFTFYLLGAEADPALCPSARISSQGFDRAMSVGINGWAWNADGYRLGAGNRFALLRVLNYYNTVQKDAFWNNISIIRLDNQRTAALTQEASVRSTADGLLNAQWTLKLDVNGYVAGFGLAVVAGADGAVSSFFNILADRFAVAMPGLTGPKQVFTIGNINGVATVGISGDLIVDGTIVTRNLIDASVTTQKAAPSSMSRTGSATSNFVNMGLGNTAVATSAVDISDGAIGSPPSIPVTVLWSCQVNHTVNVDPANAFLVWLEWQLPGSGTWAILDGPYGPNSRNFLGEVYPGFTRNIELSLTTRGTYSFRVIAAQSSGSSFRVEKATTKATALLR